MSALYSDIGKGLEDLAHRRPDIWKLSACGVTRSERPIPALLDREAYACATSRTRVLLVGGLSGRQDDVGQALNTLKLFADAGESLSGKVALSAVPCGNLDGLMMGKGPDNGAGGNPSIGYPPEDGFFYDPQNPEVRYLWRWICFQAPDLILELQAGPSVSWEANAAANNFVKALGANNVGPGDNLLAAIGVGNADGLAPIPGLRLTTPKEAIAPELERLWNALPQVSPIGPSPARLMLDARRPRTPMEIARILASTYGHKLEEPIMYTQGVSISGRLRLAELDPASPSPVADITALVEPYLSGVIDPFGDETETHKLAGIVWADELAKATSDKRYADLAVRAANYYAPRGRGEPPSPADPDFRTEDMFMAGTMLGRAYRITGERSYLDMLAGLLLDGNIQQDDGLFWHCRSAPYYWGRGNGFAAMGLAETLTYLPHDHPHRSDIVAMHVKLLDGLRRLQQPSGMYLQVLDFPGSYQEHTATCMIGYSIARGIRLGWLDSSYRDSLQLAWQGVSERIDDEGNVVDSCTGTGVQENVRGYLDRPAIFGYDDRGGSMAIWFAVEMERLLRG